MTKRQGNSLLGGSRCKPTEARLVQGRSGQMGTLSYTRSKGIGNHGLSPKRRYTTAALLCACWGLGGLVRRLLGTQVSL